ncbi:MAG: hypothetical protein C4576_23310 [Desulfobacteraceae bacterium]|nr:MAG: hypothetical protein C4576_23310 [Desulfobacteraceae bacterium]
MASDPIDTLCTELKRKLIEIRERRIVGKISFEADVNQGGIGAAKLKVITEEVCNLKSKA